jgi:uncharacterized damage-inducible protein DinB
MNGAVLQELQQHWDQLRGMTYDLLDVITPDDLHKKLPFPESQDIFFQFVCMAGTQESFIPLIKTGIWEGWESSLSAEGSDNIRTIRLHLQAADNELMKALESVDLLQVFDDGGTPMQNYLLLVEHESHHQGQLINFIYALGLPIPESWAEKWALSRD